jgi:putative beta-barrel porin BBP2
MKPKFANLMIICAFCLITPLAHGYQLTFQPRISFGVEYSDNIFLEPDNIDEINEDPSIKPESDFIFVTTPGFTAEMLGRQNGLSMSYDFGYAKYDEFSNNDDWRHNLDFSAWSSFSRNSRLEFRNTFLYTEDPLGGRAFEVVVPPEDDTPADPTTLASREPYWINTASLRFDHEFEQNRSYFLEFSNIHREDDNDLGNNIVANIPAAGLAYWFGPDWGTEIEGSYTWGDYENAPDIRAWFSSLRVIRRMSRPHQIYLQSRQRIVDQRGDLEDFLLTTRRTLEDWKVYDLQLGTIYSPSSDLTLEVSGGVVHYNPDLTDERTEFTGLLDITKTFRQGSAQIYAARGYGESLFTTRSDLGPSLFTEVGLSGDYPVSRNVTLNAFASYRKDEYGVDQRALLAGEIDPDLPPIPEEDLERTDDNYGAGAGITYEMRSWVSFDLVYAFRKLESNLEISTYDENRVTFYITLTTPREYTHTVGTD